MDAAAKSSSSAPPAAPAGWPRLGHRMGSETGGISGSLDISISDGRALYSLTDLYLWSVRKSRTCRQWAGG
jgi:hypothetical protein